MAELRSAGVGVSRVCSSTTTRPESSDLFKAVLTMLDPQVSLTLLALPKPESRGGAELAAAGRRAGGAIAAGGGRRGVAPGNAAEQVVRLAAERDCDLVIIGLPSESSPSEAAPLDTDYVLRHATCRVCLVSSPPIPQDAEQEPPTTKKEG